MDSSGPGEFERTISKGVVGALRAAAERQRKKAADGTFVADGHEFLILSPESRIALSIAGDWDAIADEIGGAL